MTANRVDSNNKVTSACLVLAHITVKLKDGSIADATKILGKPSWLVMGDGSFSEAFEEHLINKKVGDNLVFELESIDAFGESHPDLIQFMDVSHFPKDIELKTGSIVGFEQPNGDELPGILRNIEADSVKVDFNHPLAGESIIFEIEILQIKN